MSPLRERLVGEKQMVWAILVFAGALEVVWLVALKQSANFARPAYGVFSVVVAWLSFALLSVALRKLPAGTVYAVWTGVGAVGGAIAGMLLFGESREPVRLFCIALIVAGILGVKLTQ